MCVCVVSVHARVLHARACVCVSVCVCVCVVGVLQRHGPLQRHRTWLQVQVEDAEAKGAVVQETGPSVQVHGSSRDAPADRYEMQRQ